jgi:hypothetical protein
MSIGTDPAFPTIRNVVGINGHDVSVTEYYGLTKREMFAAMALQGILARDDYPGSAKEKCQDAVTFADGVLLELDRSKA